jgi:hypothetical protein
MKQFFISNKKRVFYYSITTYRQQAIEDGGEKEVGTGIILIRCTKLFLKGAKPD